MLKIIRVKELYALNNEVDFTHESELKSAYGEFKETLILKFFAKIWDIQSKIFEYIKNAISSV